MKKQSKTFVIQDWAGNELFNGQTFPGFEEAWGFIYEFLDKKFPGGPEEARDEMCSDYYVVEKE